VQPQVHSPQVQQQVQSQVQPQAQPPAQPPVTINVIHDYRGGSEVSFFLFIFRD
jgi:hypothetical protein